MDINEMVKSAINSQATGHIATALGTDAQTASKAVSTALPTIIGGLVKQASSPSGASNLYGALDKVDSGMLNDLGSALSGGKLQSVIESGTKLLPTVFGSNYSAVFGSLGKLSGLGSGKIGPLLGMLVPIVMGVLAKIKNTSGLDLAGFSQLLIDQKKHLAGLDSGLADQSGLGNLSGAVQPAMTSAGKSLSKVAEASRPVASAGRMSISAWLIPLLALAAAALALYLFVFTRDGEVVPAKYPASDTAPTAGPSGPGKAPGQVFK